MNKETGEPAFPLFAATGHSGMTLRDYFAAQALQGILAVHASPDTDKWLVAVDCYQYADMLLKARSR
jgi:hypothetical protein